MERPLEGIRVLDLSIFLSGPYATMLLAGLGAEVIKVERPGSGDPARGNPPYCGEQGVNMGRPRPGDMSLSLLKRGRNKLSVSLNLKAPEAREMLLGMADKSDILIENFSAGTMGRLGLGPDVLLQRNPALIFCSISGFGQTGPYRDLPAFDPVVQAMSGAMQVTGFSDGPPLRSGVALGDQVAALFAVIGLLSALNQRRETGKGQVIDVSMMDCLFALVMDEALDVYRRAGIPIRTGNQRPRLTPFSAYRTGDGYMAICTGSNEHWFSVLRAMGRQDLIDEGFYAKLEDRMANCNAVDAFVEEWTSGVPTATAIELLRAQGVACGRVEDFPGILEDPQLQTRGMVKPLYHPIYGELQGAGAFGMPLKFSDAVAEFDRPAPMLGQDNEAVYGRMLGLGPERLKELQAKGVI